jgi:hypothetical protein
MMSKIKLAPTWLAGAVVAVLALANPGAASATEYTFSGAVQNLGSLGNPGTLGFGDSGALGDNDGDHFDYIFGFTLTDSAKIDANVAADGTDFSELHAVIYSADPSGQDLFSNGDPGIVGGGTNTSLIDIGSFSNFLSGGSSNGNAAGAGLASLASGSYFLRIFGVPVGAVSHFVGQIAASSVAATPIPAALPLFLSAMGALGFVARRRKPATAVSAA